MVQDLFSEKDLEELVQRVSTTSELNPSLFDDLKEKASTSSTRLTLLLLHLLLHLLLLLLHHLLLSSSGGQGMG